MTHHHHDNHDHDHHHSQPSGGGEMSYHDKLVKRLQHWKDHNDEHGSSYRTWAQQIRERGYGKAADLLDQAADRTQEAGEALQRAVEIVHSGPQEAGKA